MSGKRARKLRRAGVALALGAAVLLGNVGAAVGASYTVKATANTTWRPKTLEIKKGDKVVWKNPTSALHNVKAYGGNWRFYAEISPGDPASKRFRSKGTFKYRCTFQGHSDVEDGFCEGMCGKIIVRRRSG